MKRLLVIFALFFVPLRGVAQTGLPPFGSLDRIGLEVRNNQDLNVLLAIPIVSSPGRGLPLNFSVVYNSSIWKNTGTAWTPNTNNAAWGWTTVYSTGTANYKTTTSQRRCNNCPIGDGCLYIDTTSTSNYTYTDQVGTVHSFSGVSWSDVFNECTQVETISGTFTGYASDGSGYYLSIDSSDGSIISVLSRGGLTVYPGFTDTNGNYISATTPLQGETDWTDSAGRVPLKVITGTSSIQYKVLDPTGAYQTTILNLQTLNVKTHFGCAGINEYTGTVSVPLNLVLPNNQQYSFTYESYVQNSTTYYTGRLQKITFPAGGYHEYDYTGSNDGVVCADGTTLSMNRVVGDGLGSTATWNYVRNTTSSPVTTTITSPQLPDAPGPYDTVVAFNTSGQEIWRQICSASPCTAGGGPLRTINTSWAANGTPATVQTILENGSTQSEVDTTYDSNGLLDSASEYDWGSGARGNLLRTTTYTYQTSTNYTNRNILDLVTSKQIKDGSGTIQYRQDITYDGTSGDNQSCPTGIPQHNDTSYGCTFYYRGNPTSVTTYLTPGTPANGITKNFTYDFFGNLLTAQLNCCQNKTWGYSSASTTQNYSLPDSVTSGTSPSLRTTLSYYLPTGQVNTATDPNGLVTLFSYDSLRRPTQMIQKVGGTQVGGTVSYSYNDTNFVTTTSATIDSTPKSVQQVTSFDSLGRPNLSTTEDLNNTVISKVGVQYDLAGRAYQTSNPYTGSSTTYWTVTQFDVLGRPTSIKAPAPDSSATTISYSLNTTSVTDPAGRQHKSVNDGAGRLVSIYEPDPTNNNSLTLQTNYAYNVLDEITTVTPVQGSQTRSYSYDALGRLLSATTPEAGRVCFGSVTGGTCNADGYDSFDNLLKRTDARGVLTTYGYDTLNRLTSISYNVTSTTAQPTSSVGLTYGNDSSCNSAHGTGCIGQLITVTDGPGSENYTYNNLEQLTQLQKVINGTTYTTSYAYNLAGELTQITYPSLRVVQQSVDAVGRLCEIAPSTSGCGTAASPYATGYGYSATNQLTGFKYGNGIYASFGYTPDRLQLNCLDYSTTNRGVTCAHDTTTKFGLSYSYASAGSNDGLISGIADNSGTQQAGRSVNYTYDSLYRLTQAITTGSSGYPQWGLSESYDRYGNRNAQATIQGQGCTGITCPTFSATASTSTNQLPSPYAYDLGGNMTNDGNNTLVYDAENHAVSATNGSSAGAYVYDGNGLRVQKCLPSCGGSNPNTVYIFSGSKVIAEYDNGAAVGSPSREYIYSGAALLAKIDSSGTNYYHQDHLSNRLVTDSSGNTVGEQGHFPFGEQWYPAPPASPATKWEFTTYERDAESGNDYAQARYNVSRLGRFSSPDPIPGSAADPQSLNRYSYVRNMPVMLADPLGLTPGGGGCNTVQQNPDNDTKAGDGSGPSFLDAGGDADPDPPQRCGGGPAPCEYTLAGCGSGFGPPGGLDGGASADDSGLGPTFGVGQSPGDLFSISGGLFYSFAGSDSFHWLDYDLEELLGFAAQGEISVSTTLLLNINALTPTDPQGPGGGSIDAARKLVQQVLERKNDCSKFFNGATMVELSAMFGGFSTAGQFFNSDKIQYDTGTPPVLPPTATAGAYEGAGAGATIWIKPGGLFDKAPNNGANTIGGYLGGTLGAQAEALLHELAHTLSLIPGDSKDPLQSWANEGIIDKNCYYAILAAMNTK